MRDNYIKAVANDTGRQNIFCRIASFFTRVPDTNNGLGAHYIVDLVGTGAVKIVSVVCENHDIPVIDFRNVRVGNEPIRNIVNRIMDHSPPRCAILLDARTDEFSAKIRKRIANMHCDLRFRRVVFCLANQETGSVNCIHVPGSTDDKMNMLLYHLPDRIRNQALSLDSLDSLDCFRPLAEAMVDYVLFEPGVWKHVHVDGTLNEFLSTALYQIVRRVCHDPGVDDGNYPSFEVNWRREIAPRLKHSLLTPPDALCPRIHRVIPIGVSSSDAMQAMQVAIPKDIQDPYAITVRTAAVDDQCGSIAITQPMQYTVVNVNCLINPGILVDVCRELRTGHKAVVSEVHAVRKELSLIKSVMIDTHEETHAREIRQDSRLSVMTEKLEKMATLISRLTGTSDGLVCPVNTVDVLGKCSKPKCDQIVTKRFRSGKPRRQCDKHLAYAHGSK
jgi:hypothetical protein